MHIWEGRAHFTFPRMALRASTRRLFAGGVVAVMLISKLSKLLFKYGSLKERLQGEASIDVVLSSGLERLLRKGRV